MQGEHLEREALEAVGLQRQHRQRQRQGLLESKDWQSFRQE